MKNLLRRASLVALLVGVNLVVGSRSSAGAGIWDSQHCQWRRTGLGGCVEGCVTQILWSCGWDPCWLDYSGGCPD